MKEILLVSRAIHPPLILIFATWIVLFYCGINFPQTMLYVLLTLFTIIAVITYVLHRESKKKRMIFVLLLAIGCICSLFVHEFFVKLSSVLCGILLTVILIVDSIGRYNEYTNIFNQIKDARKISHLGRILKTNKRSWCKREAAKAAFLKKGEEAYMYAKDFYSQRKYCWYNIFPDGGIRIWFNVNFWKSIGVI